MLEALRPGATPAKAAAALSTDVSGLIGASTFDLQPLFDDAEANGVQFFVMALRGIDRTLPPEQLYAIAADLRRALGLISCEPDIGADVFVDPEEALPAGVESAVVDSYCWAPGAPPPDKRWALDKTGVLRAWQASPAKGAGVVIAQPDTGVTDHPEIADAALDLSRSLNLLEGGKNPKDPLRPGTANPGHGTATGSVAASAETGQIAGSAPRATLVPIRCTEDVKIFDGSPVAKAVDHAVKIGAHVITMSLGGIWSRSLRQAIRKAVDRDMIVLAAAGNCVGLVVWPAAFDDVIAVGGTNIQDKLWQGSSSGAKIDFCAPAEFVWRADRQQAGDPKDKVSAGQGTSFAVALTAGIAALWLAQFGRDAILREARRRSTNVQELFRAAARQTARRPAQWGHGMGTGVVDAGALVALSLRDIDLSGAARTLGDAGGLESALETVLGPGQFDSRFDWSAHAAETSALLLADAKVGRAPSGEAVEARAFQRVSRGLSNAAGLARDARLAQLVLRTGLAAPALVTSETVDQARLAGIIKGLAASSSGGTISPEGAGAMDLADAQASLDKKGRRKIVQPLVKRLEKSGRSGLAHDVADIEASLDKLHREGPSARLPEAAAVRLEALVSLTDRPALPVTTREEGDRTIQTVDASDPGLGNFSGLVSLALDTLEASRFGSVGRIDSDGIHIGTGFVIGDGLVVTNRHVLESLASPLPRAVDPERWLLNAPATIDFSPSGEDPVSRFAIEEVMFCGPQPILRYPIDYAKLDLALLRVATTNTAKTALPAAIPVAGGALPVAATNLFVVGYPAPPTTLPRDDQGRIRRDVVERLRELFGLDYHRKYFSPGVVQQRSHRWVLDHDATTLGGNSGSLTGELGRRLEAIGLHFAGDWLRANHAHILSEVLAEQPQLAKLIAMKRKA
ncbi:S8 family serine peptidase [Mesorhizobium sp. LSHC432A00]|uniref:S8 family serine peptidase n=1 Tax=Mesorhizobium sp. LSHC432A00 TaxID=1287303 RepID=UPI0018DE62A7|nr:S8 family serine peptidase [Mesorhizobium sp. LSHC432A00]